MASVYVRLTTLLLGTFALRAEAQAVRGPDTVVVQSGTLRLRGLIWRPGGSGPFPAVLFNHGSGRGGNTSARWRDQVVRLRQPAIIGPVFARHGYVFLFLFRRGTGLSEGQGEYSGDVLEKVIAKSGLQGRNARQVELLEGDELDDAFAGLSFLRSLRYVDASRLAVVGHSFGGSLTLLVAERDSTLRAAVDFAGAAGSWDRSPPLQTRLRGAVRSMVVPVFILHASNDYSVAPAKVLGPELTRRARAHRVRIYPAVGSTAEEGHSFLFLNVSTWERDVFQFLDALMRP